MSRFRIQHRSSAPVERRRRGRAITYVLGVAVLVTGIGWATMAPSQAEDTSSYIGGVQLKRDFTDADAAWDYYYGGATPGDILIMRGDCTNMGGNEIHQAGTASMNLDYRNSKFDVTWHYSCWSALQSEPEKDVAEPTPTPTPTPDGVPDCDPITRICRAPLP